MAGRAGSAQGIGLVLLLAIAWIVGRCSGGADEPHAVASQTAPTPAVTALSSTVRAPRETRYVDASTLNLRDRPEGSVVGKAARGTELAVEERRDGWVRVVTNGQGGWVAERYTCGTSGCARQAAPPLQPRARPQSWSGGCPCSGSRNCTGPRGGRYCITSGGNKRYR